MRCDAVKEGAVRTPAPRGGNPLEKDWTGRYGLPPFAEVEPEHFAPAFAAAMDRHRCEVDAITGDGAKPDFRQHHCGAGGERPPAGTRRRRVLQPRRRPHERGPARGRARDRAEARRPSQRNPARRQALRAHRRPSRARAMHTSSTPSSGACSSCSTSPSCAPVRGSRRQPRRGSRKSAPPRTRHAILPERAEGRARLAARAGRRGRSRGLAGPGARRRGERRGRGGLSGKHAITLARSSVESFLQFSARRDLREEAFKAWARRGELGGEMDNRAIVAEIVALRAELARLIG